MSKVKWIIKNQELPSGVINEFMNEFGCGYLLAAALCTRGITDVKKATAFMRNNEIWHDPMLLPDMALAINRIKRAKNSREKVAVFGDYDADGITATAILKDCFEHYGIETYVYLPDRNADGYGMNKNAVDKLSDLGIKLIVTVDCGIACKDEIFYAYTLGIDTIVTDHHNCPEVIPECCAVVNPKRKDCVYPCKNLAGAGVAYKVACALIGEECAEKYLEWAAIGTVADIVELKGENRKIVFEGLKIINSTPSFGVEALLHSSSKTEVDSSSVSYILAPRINCAGRIGTPYDAYNLITADNSETASIYAEKLNELNRERQSIEHDIYDEAIEIIKNRALYNDKVIVLGSEGWNPGVIGIVASKITERVCKPCILIAYDDTSMGRGSGRSVEGFDLYDAIKDSESHLIKFGGHSQAAGLSINKENEEIFRREINNYAERNQKNDSEIRKLTIDAMIEPEALTIKNIEELAGLEPCGTGNEKPIFAISGAKISDMRELSQGKHLKLILKKNDSFIDAIAFGYGGSAKKLYKGMEIHIAGYVDINDYTGNPQITVKDILF